MIVVGAGGSIDTDKITSPVIGFITDSKGLITPDARRFEDQPHLAVSGRQLGGGPPNAPASKSPLGSPWQHGRETGNLYI